MLDNLYLIFERIGTQALISIAALAAILLCEAMILGYRNSSTANILSGRFGGRRDLLSYVLDITGALRIIGHAVTLGAGYLTGHFIKQHLDINTAASLPGVPLQIAFVLFFKSFFDYWSHRLMHTVPVLWEIHKYHHAALEMNVVTAHKESILVAPWTSFFLALPLAVIGTPATTIIAVAVILELHALLIHSQFKFTFGIGEWLLISPLAHRLHHSTHAEHRDKNFGFLFSFWDHAFGTYMMDTRKITVGTADHVYNNANWWGEMVHCVKSVAFQLRKLAP